MSGTLECECGHKMRLDSIEDAPICCPKCGGGRMPEGMTKKELRAARAAFARAKLKQDKALKAAFDQLAADMDAMREREPPTGDAA